MKIKSLRAKTFTAATFAGLETALNTWLAAQDETALIGMPQYEMAVVSTVAYNSVWDADHSAFKIVADAPVTTHVYTCLVWYLKS